MSYLRKKQQVRKVAFCNYCKCEGHYMKERNGDYMCPKLIEKAKMKYRNKKANKVPTYVVKDGWCLKKKKRRNQSQNFETVKQVQVSKNVFDILAPSKVPILKMQKKKKKVKNKGVPTPVKPKYLKMNWVNVAKALNETESDKNQEKKPSPKRIDQLKNDLRNEKFVEEKLVKFKHKLPNFEMKGVSWCDCDDDF